MILSKDHVIEILEFGRENLLDSGSGITFEETLKRLTDKGIVLKDPAVIWTVLNNCFMVPTGGEARHKLRIDSYFSHLEYIELQEARASSKTANRFAISALVITIITSAFSIYYSKKQIDTPTEIENSQFDSLLKINQKLHLDLIDLNNNLARMPKTVLTNSMTHQGNSK